MPKQDQEDYTSRASQSAGNTAGEVRSAAAATAHDDHGGSLAAWVTVGIVIVGSLVMAFAVALTALWLFLVGVVVTVLGVVVGKVLAGKGKGQTVTQQPPTSPHRSVR